MSRLLSWLIGVGIGTVVGAGVAALFAPTSGKQLVRVLKESYAETFEGARQAAENRRAELEAELTALQKGTPRLPPRQ